MKRIVIIAIFLSGAVIVAGGILLASSNAAAPVSKVEKSVPDDKLPQ